MTFNVLKKFSRLALCVAMFFVATNVLHAAEHDFSEDVTQGHVECLHCIDEQFALVGSSKLTALPQRAVLFHTIQWLGYSPVVSYSCQARAPPVS